MSDHDRLAWHAGLTASRLKAQGVEFSYDQLLRRTAEELRLTDRAKAEGAIRRVTRTRAERDEARRTRRAARPELQAHAQARKVGGQFWAREAAPQAAAPALAMPTGLDAERLIALMARVKLLCSRGPGEQRRNGTIGDGPWLYPKFAPRLAVVMMFYARALGGYRELSYLDRQRRFLRAIEDICDESNAAVGVGWWVDRRARNAGRAGR